MPFLGTTPTQGFVGANPKQSFTANGSTTVFTLTNPVASANDLEVFVGNVRQEPTAAYTAAGTTLTMSEAPDTGLNFYVINKSQAQVTTTPPVNSISTDKIVNDAITGAKIENNPTIAGNLTVSGNTTASGTLGVTGTATLSGDLTVDTNTLKVDATNNRVGIGTTSPTAQLELSAGAPTFILNANSQASGKKKVRLASSNLTAGDFCVQSMADDGTTVNATPLKVDTNGHTIPTLLYPDKYQPMYGPTTITGGFVNGAATSTWHSITNIDVKNYAGGYSSGNVGIQGEIYWTSGTVGKGYNHTVRFTLPPMSANSATTYSTANFSSANHGSTVLDTIPITVTHHTSMTSNHDIRLRCHNSTNGDYDPIRLEIYADTAPNAAGAKLTIWRG